MQAFINAKKPCFYMELKEWAELLGAIVLCQLAGVIGSVFTLSSIPTWYATLNKPFFTPPNWVFGPVWITLYTLMGVSLFLVWKKGTKSRQNRIALGLFGVQLVLNALWSVIFFGMQSIIGGLIVIIALWFVLITTSVRFYKIDTRAGHLLVPYLLWLSLATALNAFLLILN